MKSRSNLLLVALVALVGITFLSPVARAALVFNETFESYALGDANGQGNWVDFGGARLTNIVNTLANGGSQSIEFSTNPGYGSDSYFDLAAPITAGQLSMSFDTYIPTGFDGTAQFFFSRGPTGNGPPANVFEEGLHIIANGTTGLINDTGSPSTTLLLDQWVNISINIDLDADTAVASYGGVEIFNGAWNNGGGSPVQYQGANLWATDGANVAVFNVDNFSLDLVPEPSGVTLLGLGLAGLVLRRRR